MNRAGKMVVMLVLVSLVLAAMAGCSPGGQQADTTLFIPQPAAMGDFQSASPEMELQFPRDHAAHEDYQTEWWYYTGSLESEDGRLFGYQLTFFRRALQPAEQRIERESAWAAGQVYLAHFALTDVRAGRFSYGERLTRGAAGLAGATVDQGFRVWLEDWSVEENEPGVYRMRAADGEIGLDLTLTDSKGPILQGLNGFSQKGPGQGNASMYYSFSRLDTQGIISIDGVQYPVTGSSWMDHEFSTSALSGEQAGWDWFALQLENGYELMVYNIRDSQGNVDPFSRGTWIDLQGREAALAADEFSITVTETWTSPHSGAVYPAGWILSVPGEGINLRVTPLLADQELVLSYTYWEGAVQVTGEVDGQAVSGRGYVELTGYAQSMQGQF